MSDDRKIPRSFRIIDHGSDHAQYFPGHGLAFSRYAACATGAGSDPSEAFEDAIAQLADQWNVSTIRASEDAQAMMNDHREINHDCTSDDIQTEGCEHYWYVSIDVSEGEV